MKQPPRLNYIRAVLLNLHYNDLMHSALELIFTKFYRGEKAKAAHKEGEGLGLFISMLLMNKMGGSIEAMNRDEKFTIRLLLRFSV